MRRRFARAAVVVGILLASQQAPAASEEPQSANKADRWSAWTGLSAGPSYIYAYAGTAPVSLTGDMETGGLLARLGLGGGGYRTEGDDPRDVVQYDADFMLGYRAHAGPAVVALYAGADFNHHEYQDPDSDPRGRELGAKGLIEAYFPLGEAFYLSSFGTYSTAFGNFTGDAKLAYRITEALALGPEVSAVGSSDFAQARAGLAAAWQLGDDTELAGSAGAGWDLDDADLGFYGLINLYTEF